MYIVQAAIMSHTSLCKYDWIKWCVYHNDSSFILSMAVQYPGLEYACSVLCLDGVKGDLKLAK